MQGVGGMHVTEGVFDVILLQHMKLILTQNRICLDAPSPDALAVARSRGTNSLDHDAVLALEVTVGPSYRATRPATDSAV